MRSPWAWWPVDRGRSCSRSSRRRSCTRWVSWPAGSPRWTCRWSPPWTRPRTGPCWCTATSGRRTCCSIPTPSSRPLCWTGSSPTSATRSRTWPGRSGSSGPTTPELVPALPALFEGFGVGAALARTPRVDAREVPVASRLRPPLARSDGKAGVKLWQRPTGRHRGLHPLTAVVPTPSGGYDRTHTAYAFRRNAGTTMQPVRGRRERYRMDAGVGARGCGAARWPRPASGRRRPPRPGSGRG